MIKLIVSDMDGTLLSKKGEISEGNTKAILEARNLGAKLVIATGRDYSGVDEILKRRNLSYSAILGNGAQYMDENKNMIKTAYLNKHLLPEILKVFDDLKIHYMIFTTKGFYCTKEPEVVCQAFIERGMKRFKRTREEMVNRDAKMPCLNLVKIDNLNDFLTRDLELIKVEAFHVDEGLIEQAKKQLSSIEGIAYLSSYPDNVEVTDIKAQKGYILESVITDLGIKKEEVMVLGDGLNDLTLFECFPYSYAMGNAVDEIKKMAYKVVCDHDLDGVAQAIYDQIKSR